MLTRFLSSSFGLLLPVTVLSAQTFFIGDQAKEQWNALRWQGAPTAIEISLSEKEIRSVAERELAENKGRLDDGDMVFGSVVKTEVVGQGDSFDVVCSKISRLLMGEGSAGWGKGLVEQDLARLDKTVVPATTRWTNGAVIYSEFVCYNKE